MPWALGGEQRAISSLISLKFDGHYEFRSVFPTILYRPLTKILHRIPPVASLNRPSHFLLFRLEHEINFFSFNLSTLTTPSKPLQLRGAAGTHHGTLA